MVTGLTKLGEAGNILIFGFNGELLVALVALETILFHQ